MFEKEWNGLDPFEYTWARLALAVDPTRIDRGQSKYHQTDQTRRSHSAGALLASNSSG
jgi:hypothetical protein